MGIELLTLQDRVKGRSSYDIVLLCRKCAHRLSAADGLLKAQLSAELGIPLEGNGSKWIFDDEAVRLAKVAGTLLRIRGLGQARRAELEAEIRASTGAEEVTEEVLKTVANRQTRSLNPDWQSHEQLVVATLVTDQLIEAFVHRWRRHFMDALRPQFMSPHWRTDEPVFRPN